MIESAFVQSVVDIALLILVFLLIPCSYRVAVGPSPADRLQAIDTVTTVLAGIIVLLALVQGSSFLIDVGIALAAFSFIATMSIARFLSEGRMF